LAYNPAGGKIYTLKSSISSTATTIVLSSFKVPVSDDNITMALMNTDIAYATIAPKTTSAEFISFTTITQNANGTATLTGVTRGLNKTYPFTEDSDFKLPHSGQSQFILSDAPQVFAKYGALDNDEVITGQWEAPTPLDAADVANKAYVDAVASGSPVSLNRIVVAGIAGETLTIGNSVYFKESDGRWWKTDADDASTINNVQLGIAQGAGTAGNNITGGVLIAGLDTNNTGTGGATVFLSNTAGGFSTTTGTIPRVVGQYIASSGGLYFNPNYQSVLTSYAVDAVGTDAYAITLPDAFNAYYAGMTVSFKAGTANTGACTLAVNGLSAKSIKKSVSDDLTTGDILVNQIITVVYDGTNFQITSKTSLSATTVTNPVFRVYTSNDTWSKPANLKYVEVEVVGGGGGGGSGSDGAPDQGGGGGGGGGYSKKIIAVASLGATETVTVGAAGAAGSGGDGGAGGTSSFGSHASATGGSGGGQSVPSGGAGGIGSSGTLNIQGGGGGSGATGGSPSSGLGGSSVLGGGGRGITGNDTTGVTGGVYGGGGSGGVGDAGGAGAAGVVIVTEYYYQ